ncbi:MAG: SDR family NAD(P)-dependent oxidoreductase [Polyangiaceae bacterium]
MASRSLPAEVLRVFSVNTLGALATLVPVAPRMVARGKGTLAAVTSLAGMRGLAGHAAYSASKAAVSTYLEALRVDVHGHGVDVVDVRPGFVDTPMTRDKRFPMPFLLDSTRAARLTVDGLRRGTPVVEYPFALARAMDFAEKLPDALWRRVAERLPR